jgi:hypothetical protein
MDTLRDYLNPARIYTDGLHDVGVSNLESTTPTVKESLAVRTAKSSEPAPIRENLTTESAESAEKRRVGEPGYPTANGQQVKNVTAVEKIASDDLDLQVGTAGESSEVEALDWFRQELTALYLWAKDPCLVEPLTLYELEHAEAIASYFLAAIQALAKPGTETVPNHGTKPRQSAECAWCGPVPDPDTGLVPCGCGGKAKLYHRHSTILPKQILWVVRCVKIGKCGISTPDCTRKQDAIALWNLAMSGQTAEQKPVKTWNETPPKPGLTVQVSDNPGCKL